MSITLEELVQLESQVWEALKTGDSDRDAGLLAADFLGVYPTGFATKEDHTSQLDSGPTVKWYSLEECRHIAISSHTAMLSYRASYGRPGSGSNSGSEVMYVSSLWCRRDGHWINVFSQDTPASEVELP